LNSEIKPDTRDVLLESAYFHPPAIRKAARSLGMTTDASFRFERGVDYGGVIRALNRAAELMVSLGGGYACRGYIDNYPRPFPPRPRITLREERVTAIVGTDIAAERITGILEALEMDVHPGVVPRQWDVVPPTYRLDIEREIDLIEEVARIYGYDAVPTTMPRPTTAPQGKTVEERLKARLNALLVGSGVTEVITYSFIPATFSTVLGIETIEEGKRLVTIRNPLTEEQSVLRTTLTYSLLDVLRTNMRMGATDLRIFEWGRIFLAQSARRQPDEHLRLGCLLWGARAGDSWHYPREQADFYDLKGLIENICETLKVPNPVFIGEGCPPFLHPGRAARLESRGLALGYLGEIHPEVMARMDLKGRALVAELEVAALLARWETMQLTARELSRYPGSVRDAAFVVAQSIKAGRLLEVIGQVGEELLEKVSIFDVYEGENLPAGTKSIGLRFWYRSADRTLTDDEVSEAHQRLITAIIRETNATLRM